MIEKFKHDDLLVPDENAANAVIDSQVEESWQGTVAELKGLVSPRALTGGNDVAQHGAAASEYTWRFTSAART